MKTLVIGLGNPILGDDGVGWRVVEAVQEQISDSDVDVDCAAMERLHSTRILLAAARAT